MQSIARTVSAARTTFVLRATAVETSHTIVASSVFFTRRTFYDKIKEKRDASDDGPDQMFTDFPKGPQRQRVPAELHQSSKVAVQDAEKISSLFTVSLLVLFIGGCYFIDPFHDVQLDRPEGYGVTAPKLVPRNS